MKNVQSNLPGVSCVCITYKRTDFLEEAIESFLRQDYSGKKELIIINDDNEQTLIFEHPEVKIYNFKDRFNSIGEKRNKSIEFSSYNLIML
jgi:glycosyltransferase involved in cell wall biosynthesis